MTDNDNINQLHVAASSGVVNNLYTAIQQNTRILEEIDAEPFVNTPLHSAALAGRLEFSIEIMRLKPSFGTKLNEDGFSPIHIALHNNQHNLVRRLVEINKDLVRVKGREGVTPLHFVCQSGDGEENITLLIDLLKACPDSIKDVNMKNETALHIALKNGNLRVFEKLVGWLATNVRKDADSLERTILNWKDSAGNTILHIAALNNNTKAVDLLLIMTMVDIKARNLNNQTALDLAEAHDPLPMMKRILLNCRAAKHIVPVVDDYSVVGIMKWQIVQLERSIVHFARLQISEEQRNAYMVVGTLITTAIYQTVLSPPGGLTQGPNSNNLVNATSSHNSTAAGKSVMPHKVFHVVTSLNAYIFFGGVSLIFWMMPKPSHGFTAMAVDDLLIKMVNINAKNLEKQTTLDLAEAHALPMMKRTLLKMN